MKISKSSALWLLIGLFTLSCTQKNYNQTTGNQHFNYQNGNTIEIDDIDNFLKHQIDSLKIPGLSIAFFNEKKIVYQKSMGVKNIETKEQVTDSTLFDAASISKAVFAFFTMKMVDKGIIELDTPLYTYLEYPAIAHDDRYQKITARMALSHSTGFQNWRYLDADGNYDPQGKLRIDFEPGTNYQYSGEAFQYLAAVLAHQLGTDRNGLESYMEEEIFIPLEMGVSSYTWNEHLDQHRTHGHVNNELNVGYGCSAKYPNFNAASSLQTQSTYYANFLIALMNGNLLSAKSQSEILSVQSEREETEQKPGVKYGLGIIIEEGPYGTNYAHSGDNGSHTSQFVFNLEQKSGYLFFTNMENGRKNIFEHNLKSFLVKH